MQISDIPVMTACAEMEKRYWEQRPMDFTMEFTSPRNLQMDKTRPRDPRGQKSAISSFGCQNKSQNCHFTRFTFLRSVQLLSAIDIMEFTPKKWDIPFSDNAAPPAASNLLLSYIFFLLPRQEGPTGQPTPENSEKRNTQHVHRGNFAKCSLNSVPRKTFFKTSPNHFKLIIFVWKGKDSTGRSCRKR